MTRQKEHAHNSFSCRKLILVLQSSANSDQFRRVVEFEKFRVLGKFVKIKKEEFGCFPWYKYNSTLQYIQSYVQAILQIERLSLSHTVERLGWRMQHRNLGGEMMYASAQSITLTKCRLVQRKQINKTMRPSLRDYKVQNFLSCQNGRVIQTAG